MNGPIFNAESYSPEAPRVFPFCSIIKLLIAKTYASSDSEGVSVEDIKDFLFSTQAVGDEEWSYFVSLRRSPIEWSNNDQPRQVREMLVFISQAPFLKWDGKHLSLDFWPATNERELKSLFACVQPLARERASEASKEILNMGLRPSTPGGFAPEAASVIIPQDLIFSEGGRRMANHVLIERSAKLRRWYFSQVDRPKCDITGNPANAGFPWARNILDIHHILPLSSSAHVAAEGPVFDNLVALTPTSHRAVHIYYRQWLKQNGRKDFADKSEAKRVYESAKNEYRRAGATSI